MSAQPNTEHDFPVVSIRMPREFRAAVDVIAKNEGMSRGAFIRRCIVLALVPPLTVVTEEMVLAGIDELERQLGQTT